MRSGIGPADQLRRLEIPVHVDLPGVGRNLHDHTGFDIRFAPTPAVRVEIAEELVRDNPYRGQVILKAKSTYSETEFDLHLLPVQVLDSSANEIFGIGAFNMTPLSRGEVSLRGKDPSLPPKIETRYLTDPEDRDASVLVDALDLVRSLAQEESQASAKVRSDEESRAHIKSVVRNYSHAVGTCKMGPAGDPDAVVDSTGRVVGTDNVYVADASIMPVIPKANTNLTSMLIGLHTAEGLIG